MKVQFQEEQAHTSSSTTMSTTGAVGLQVIDQPPVEFQSPLDAFEKTLAHEQKVTGHINDLYALAVEEKDFASQIILQWFVEEQVEEEKTAGDIVKGKHKQQIRQRRTSMKDKIRLEEAWQLAIQREQEAKDFYKEMAGMVEDSALKNLFAHLIEQEKKHKQLLEEEYEKMFMPEN
jgi:hypothetical protein